MSKKHKDSDLRNAGTHFRNAALECILGSAYLAKGIGDISKNRNYRQQLLDSAYNLVDSGLSLFIRYAEEQNRRRSSATRDKRKSSNRTRKIKID